MNQNEQDLDIFPLIKKRWSPRAFSKQEIEESKILSLLEAARWSPSASNEQPWRFVIGRRGDEKYQKIYEALDNWNKAWIREIPPVLILNLTKKHTMHSGRVNPTAEYDLGQAVFAMVLEALHLGLIAHEMSGFDHKKILELLDLSDEYEPVSVTVFGYHGDDKQLPDDYYRQEHRVRERKPIEDLLL
ncbi:MAG: nitroreductase family protein [Bacteroidales bacterium]|nr:nitroreductase family protein [Bacteroidales bacterium]